MLIWVLEERGAYRAWDGKRVPGEHFTGIEDLFLHRLLCFPGVAEGLAEATAINAAEGTSWAAVPVELADAPAELFEENFYYV